MLDVGCGTGWLAGYWEPDKYTGIDLSAQALKIARKEHPKHLFIAGDAENVEKRYDIVLASGLFQFVPTGEALVRIVNLFRHTYKMLAFNMLSVKARRKDANDCYHSPDEVLQILNPLIEKFEILHNYLPQEFTVRIFK